MREEANAEKCLLEAITNCKKEDGWANLADIGKSLRDQNIHYGKLNKFVQRYSNVVELKVDDQVAPPVAYARQKE